LFIYNKKRFSTFSIHYQLLDLYW